MKVLLDTQVWLWMLGAPDRLGDEALGLVEDPSVTLLLSAASSWEIAIKWGLGKLTLPDAPQAYVPDRIRSSGVTPLPISHGHALAVAGLESHHRDPFDRLLIAQAIAEDVAVLTADPVFGHYPVERIPAA